MWSGSSSSQFCLQLEDRCLISKAGPVCKSNELNWLQDAEAQSRQAPAPLHLLFAGLRMFNGESVCVCCSGTRHAYESHLSEPKPLWVGH